MSYEKGTPVWVRQNASEAWTAAMAQQGGSYTTYSGETITVSAGPETVQLMHQTSVDTVEDMSKLADLHEGALIHNIRQRYMENNIYTFIGSIVSAVNPYERLPLYGEDLMTKYRGCNLGELPPHVYAIANEAYTGLFRAQKSQCVLISGESGAGKTENTKVILRYLSNISGGKSGKSSVEQQILDANPILEAFGNAKTVHNNNSSRFGKYISIAFTSNGTIEGAKIDQYLLEKNRVVSQNADERNFHIFYNICFGCPDDLREVLNISQNPNDYAYLNKSGSITADGIDDVQSYQEVVNGMKTMQFSDEDIANIMKTMGAILHLSNTKFLAVGDGASIVDETCVSEAARLLRLDVLRLSKCLTHKTVKIREESVSSPLSAALADSSRDSIAMAVYKQTFEWLVARINGAFTKSQSKLFIGVLDIFGFENFIVNSFEQFCINFANEKLQEYFNNHIFSLEQAEYAAEGISWENIDYVDNVPCVELIEKKLGIISMLDEESNFPKGTDETFLEKIHAKFGGGNNDFYVQPRVRNTKFGIKHYAGLVEYDTVGFLVKNRDTFRDDIVEMLKATKSDFIFDVFENIMSDEEQQQVANSGGTRRAKKKPTIGLNFKTSLLQLMDNLNSSNPFFVRCIKPNKNKAPRDFDYQMVTDQLRYSGVLETVRIRRAGFPVRKAYDDFGFRFRILLKGINNLPTDLPGKCKAILSKQESTGTQWQCGKTKVFMKEDLEIALEKARAEGLVEAMAVIKHAIMGFVIRKRYVNFRRLIIVCQRKRRAINIIRYAQQLQSEQTKEAEEEDLREETRLGETRQQEELRRQEELKLEREQKEAELTALDDDAAKAEAQAALEEEMKKKEEQIVIEEEEKEREGKAALKRRVTTRQTQKLKREAKQAAAEQERMMKAKLENMQRENPELFRAMLATEQEDKYDDDHDPNHGPDSSNWAEDMTEDEYQHSSKGRANTVSPGLTAHHEGYVTKQGGSIKTWKRRFLILKDGVLSYYRGKHQESVKSGYLTKQGGGTSALGSKSWKKRFFVLKGTELLYYESDGEGLVALGTINIRHCTLQEDVKVKRGRLGKAIATLRKGHAEPSEFMFGIVDGSRTYNLSADSDAARKEWIGALNKARSANDANMDNLVNAEVDTTNSINSIPVQDIYSVGTVIISGHPYAFAINCKDRVYNMKCDTSEETQEWVRLLTPAKRLGEEMEKGWLLKDGPRAQEPGKPSMSTMLSRRKRWFVLKGDVIQYFKSPNDNAPLGNIQLTSLCTVGWSNQPSAKSDQHMMVINTRGRSYQVYATSFADARRWVEAITDSVRAQEPVPTQYERIINEVLKLKITDDELDIFLDSRPILHHSKKQLKGALLPMPYGYIFQSPVSKKKATRDYGTLSEEALGFFQNLIDPEHFGNVLQVAKDMVHLCFSVPKIINEIACQLMKQTSNHPDHASVEFERNMQLMLVLCHTARISNRVKRYMRVHINRIIRKSLRHTVAEQYGEECLQALELYRDRSNQPCEKEIESMTKCEAMAVEIDCGFSTVRLQVKPHMAVREVGVAIAKEIGLDACNSFGVFEHTVTERGDTVNKALEQDVVVCDRIAKWHRFAKGGITLINLGYKFVFRCVNFTAPPGARLGDVERNLLFEQAVERFHKGLFRAQQSSTSHLAALHAIYLNGPCSANPSNDPYKYLPLALMPPQHTAYKTDFTKSWQENSEMTKEQARDAFMDMYNDWEGSQGTIFVVRNCEGGSTKGLPKQLWLCVDINGLSLFGVQGADALVTFKYTQILSFGAPVPQTYKIVVDGSVITFETRQVLEIANLMKGYIAELMKRISRGTLRRPLRG